MERKCQKCGNLLAQNDFLCPNCGAIYGEPVLETPKQEEKPAPAPPQPKQRKLPLAIFSGIAVLLVIVCLIIWGPFRPKAPTPTTSPIATTSIAPTRPPTTLPPTVPTTVPPTTVPPTTVPFNQTKIDWTMDAKVVDGTGRLISNGTVTICGDITKNLESADRIVLEIIFPPTLPYIVMPKDYTEYFDFSNGFYGSYYICKAAAYDRIENAPEFIRFALDVEAQCALFILPEITDQYLVCSTAADVNVEEVMAHFQKFLDDYT